MSVTERQLSAIVCVFALRLLKPFLQVEIYLNIKNINECAYKMLVYTAIKDVFITDIHVLYTTQLL